MATEFYSQPTRSVCIGLIIVAISFGFVPAIALWVIYAGTVTVQNLRRKAEVSEHA